jgi:hypothetical protein
MESLMAENCCRIWKATWNTCFSLTVYTICRPVWVFQVKLNSAEYENTLLDLWHLGTKCVGSGAGRRDSFVSDGFNKPCMSVCPSVYLIIVVNVMPLNFSELYWDYFSNPLFNTVSMTIMRLCEVIKILSPFSAFALRIVWKVRNLC